MGVAPWIMWGSDQQIAFSGNAGGITSNASAQLSRVDFGRPDTFSFFLSALVTAANAPNGDTGNATLSVDYDLTIGLGRSVVQIRSFEHYEIVLGFVAGLWDGSQQLVYSTEVVAPKRTAASTDQNIIRELPTQSVNIAARCTLATAFDVELGSVTCSAYFCPRTHLRPEWFKGGNFKGGEDNGA
jgi:hypothetical protein